ncbi:endo-1,4-beta-xylanase [Demequina aurantiaca]|uniref:endo-1,4-beta-xylanase n=1 Tax=Demequina aurantiaca TaxID=676200 RepID=UPI000783BA0C|nr:endo-1,4-beta-xylanase [Demequina aurantiaca]
MTTIADSVPTSLDHRRGRTTVTVVDGSGTLIPHTDILLEQVRHAFGFGNIGFDLIDFANEHATTTDDAVAGSSVTTSDDNNAAFAQEWLSLFNMATLPFYWARFEPTPGHPDTARLLAAARWFKSHDVSVKGHPLLWHTLAPRWLMDVTETQAESAMRARIKREVEEFAGVIDHWDAINESVILPRFTAETNAVTRLAQSQGRVETVRLAFDTARAANPQARLVLNDFDLSPEYEHVISECLDAGIQIDAIGLQTHMHQGYRGEDEIWEILERFARFGLPLQMTETSLVSGDLMPAHIVDLNDFAPADWPSTAQGEARQAAEITRHYRNLFAHPSVESVTYWGLSDATAWLGAPSGLLRTNGSRKPAFDAIHDLIKSEWWHPAGVQRTDEAGRLRVQGFAGTYRMSHRGVSADFAVEAGHEKHLRVVLGA